MTEPRLTIREREILLILADGRTMKDAAASMGISVQTIKNHCSAIYRELGATGLVNAYHRLGWLKPR